MIPILKSIVHIIFEYRVVAVILIFLIPIIQSCDNEDELKDFDSKNYLEINVDLNHFQLSNLSNEDASIYIEARNRFNEIVVFNNNKYELISDNRKLLNISDKLYDHFRIIMESSNIMLRKFDAEHMLIVEKSSDNTTPIVRLRSGNETGDSGGITKVEYHWWGFEVYLPNDTLLYIAAGSSVGAYIATLVPEPTLSKVIAGAFCVSGASASVLAVKYKQGVILSFTYPITPIIGCVILNARGQ